MRLGCGWLVRCGCAALYAHAALPRAYHCYCAHTRAAQHHYRYRAAHPPPRRVHTARAPTLPYTPTHTHAVRSYIHARAVVDAPRVWLDVRAAYYPTFAFAVHAYHHRTFTVRTRAYQPSTTCWPRRAHARLYVHTACTFSLIRQHLPGSTRALHTAVSRTRALLVPL